MRTRAWRVYFRLEWKLAVDRSHRMAPKPPFLLPVVIEDTPQADDTIPDRFRGLQWTRLPAGQATPAFVERVQRLAKRMRRTARNTRNARRTRASFVPSWHRAVLLDLRA